MYLKLSPSNFSVKKKKKKKKIFLRNLNFGFCLSHPTSIFIYGVTIMSRVCGDIKKVTTFKILLESLLMIRNSQPSLKSILLFTILQKF